MHSAQTWLLAQIAHARGGDKGDCADLTLFAPDAVVYQAICMQIGPDAVASRFASVFSDPAHAKVTRYCMENLLAVKFVLHAALDGGAAYSLRSDNLGKSLAAGLLRMSVQLPPDWCPASKGKNSQV